MTPDIKKAIAELRRLDKERTQGPWGVHTEKSWRVIETRYLDVVCDECPDSADAAYIAHQTLDAMRSGGGE